MTRAELRLQRLDHVAGVHAFGHGDGCGRRCRRSRREEREAESDEPGARRGGVELRVVDERDAALFEIAARLAGNVVERRAEAGDERNGGRVGALALDGVLALLAQVEVVAGILCGSPSPSTPSRSR